MPLPVQRIFVDGKHADTRLTAKLSASACGEDVCPRYIALLHSGMPSWVLYRYRPERPRGGFGGKWWPRSPLRPARPPPARQSHFSCCSTPWHACMLLQSVSWGTEGGEIMHQLDICCPQTSASCGTPREVRHIGSQALQMTLNSLWRSMHACQGVLQQLK